MITVVGLGVVGGSFVKALKGQGHEVYGVDVDEETLARAKADGCIKEGFVDGREIIKKSDMTIICLYPSLVLDYIKNPRSAEEPCRRALILFIPRCILFPCTILRRLEGRAAGRLPAAGSGGPKQAG